jgi:hypothetical protein
MTTKKLPNEWLLLSLHLPIKSGINFIWMSNNIF